ncbi:hypothetical protein ACWDTP_34070 [Mycobacterium sp. NPDC003449]
MASIAADFPTGTHDSDQTRPAVCATIPRPRALPSPTSFTRHYTQGAQLLAAAITSPTQTAFDAAHRSAIRAIGASFCGDDLTMSVQWDLGQSLAASIADAAQRFGFKAPR